MSKRSRPAPVVGLHHDLEGNVSLQVKIPPEMTQGVKQTVETLGVAIELAEKVSALRAGPVGNAVEAAKGVIRLAISAGRRKR